MCPNWKVVDQKGGDEKSSREDCVIASAVRPDAFWKQETCAVPPMHVMARLNFVSDFIPVVTRDAPSRTAALSRPGDAFPPTPRSSTYAVASCGPALRPKSQHSIALDKFNLALKHSSRACHSSHFFNHNLCSVLAQTPAQRSN